MNWLNAIADELERRHPDTDKEILIETGASPSGTFHIGHIREWATGDAIQLELRRRGRKARLIHFIDDLDALRKIPVNVPADFEQYLGMPLCDIPAPDASANASSYGAYFTQGVIDACEALGIDMEFIESHKKYRGGFFVPAIERSLQNLDAVRHALTTVSGRQLDEHWSPIQILENGRLKKRSFVSIDTDAKTLVYLDVEGEQQTVAYDTGLVKLDWRLDFPAHWWLQSVACEPSGRDHSTKGGSVDTGEAICRAVYGAEPPLAVPYDFINMVGDTKKMSASKGTGLDAVEGAKILPAEVLRFFILRHPPSKRLYFDPIDGVVQLMDEFAAFAAKDDRTESEEQLLYVCTRGINRKIVSRVPFSLLVNAYQAALKDADRTLEIVSRTEYAAVAAEDAEIVKAELQFIDEWLQRHAPEDVKFALTESVNADNFNDAEKAYLQTLADKIAAAPADADGAWFHNAIYELKDTSGLPPKELFTTLYRAIIGKTSGPRAGWFLSILPRDWLVNRLRFEV
jgi:lysyl-tRNA synthetase class 1